MKKIFLLCMAMLSIVFLCPALTVAAADKASSGEQAFMQNCASCHMDGGNIINPAKTLKQKDMEANGIKKPRDIVEKMRKPGPGMIPFDKEKIPDKEAEAIAEYILKTFK